MGSGDRLAARRIGAVEDDRLLLAACPLEDQIDELRVGFGKIGRTWNCLLYTSDAADE